jgi:predicted PurR-regulated permease PerM
MKQLVRITAISLATLSAVLIVWELRTALIFFILSLVFAAVLRPVIDRLSVLGLPRSLSLVLTYMGIISIFVIIGLTLGGPFLSELQRFLNDLPAGYQQLEAQWLNGSLIQQTIARNLQDLNNLFQIANESQWTLFVQNILGITLGSLGLAGNILVILVLSIYWTADQEHFMRLWISLLSLEWRTRAKEVWQNIESEIGSYLRSELIQSLLTLILLGIGYHLIGLKYPISLALVGAIGWLIIWFGGLIALIPALLAGLSISPMVGLLTALFTIAVLAFLEFVVEPRLYDRRRISSLLAVILVLIMIKQYGIIGFWIAPPLAAAIQIVAGQLIHPSPTAKKEVLPPPSMQVDQLRERLSSIQTLIASQSEPPPPEIVNLVARLDKLIERANQQEEYNDL